MATHEDSATHKATSDTVEDSEPGRKYQYTPEEHLRHLLNIGYLPDSPLIKKYLIKRNLTLPHEYAKKLS
jgi:hypothetical protein